MNPSSWYLIVLPDQSAQAELSLGNCCWPWTNDMHLRRSWDQVTHWHPIDTLDAGETWVPLVTDESAARLHLQEARKTGPAQCLRLSTRNQPDVLGWDVGPPQGGHSCWHHEMHDPGLDNQRLVWVNDHGLLRSNQAAREFWESRERLSTERPDWETPSGWSIISIRVVLAG